MKWNDDDDDVVEKRWSMLVCLNCCGSCKCERDREHTCATKLALGADFVRMCGNVVRESNNNAVINKQPNEKPNAETSYLL